MEKDMLDWLLLFHKAIEDGHITFYCNMCLEDYQTMEFYMYIQDRKVRIGYFGRREVETMFEAVGMKLHTERDDKLYYKWRERADG